MTKIKSAAVTPGAIAARVASAGSTSSASTQLWPEIERYLAPEAPRDDQGVDPCHGQRDVSGVFVNPETDGRARGDRARRDRHHQLHETNIEHVREIAKAV